MSTSTIPVLLPVVPSSEPPTRIAIVGCGYWGVNYVRVFSELPDASVAVVCDADPHRLDAIARRFPDTVLTESLEEALALTDFDAVVVCTPATTHRAVGEAVIQAGKHVLIEKPLATTPEDAEYLTSLAEDRGVTLLVGHTFLYNAGVRAVKGYIDRGEVGKLYYLYARRTNMGPIRTDVGALGDLVPHDLSIFNYLLGSTPEWVSAVSARVLGNGHDDVGFVSLGYPDDIVAHIHVSWAEPNKVREVVVVGSDTRIMFNDLDALERVRVFQKGVRWLPPEEPTSYGEHVLQMRDGDIVSPALATFEPLKHLCGHFLHCVRRGDAPFTTGQSGVDVVRVMEAIELSAIEYGKPVRIRSLGMSPGDERELDTAG
jgi:predicted dehydrogenase